ATLRAYQATYGGGPQDAFFTKRSPTGDSLAYSTYLGGNIGEQGSRIAVNSSGGAAITGYTNSHDFPTTPGAFDTSFNGTTDAFVAKFTFCSADAFWTNYGSGWPGTNGVPSLTLSGDPVLCAPLTLNLSNSRGATTTAALLLGLSQADLPTVFGGHLLLVPRTIILLTVPASGIALSGNVACDDSLCGV